jgi:hypothetical protein
MTRPFVALGVLFAAAVAGATPWFTQDPRTLPAGHWRVEEHVLIQGINDGLANGHEAPLPNGATGASSLTALTRIRYGARDDLTVFVDIPFVDKELDTPAGPDRNSGLGDLTFLAKWKYHEHKQANHRRALAGFVKLENGEHEGLPPLVSLGSGQMDYGLVHLWEWDTKEANYYASTGYVYRDTRSDTGVNPGDWVLFNAAMEHKLGKTPMNVVIELNGRHELESRRAGASVPSSGATIVSLSPGLQYSQRYKDGTAVTFEMGVQVPVITAGDLPALPDYTFYGGAYVIF